MSFTRVLSIALLFALRSGAQEPFRRYYERQNNEASRLHARKEYAKAIAVLEELRQRQELEEAQDERAHVLYNLACAYSLSGAKAQAIAALREALETGNFGTETLERDSDFDNIRREPAFMMLVEELQTRERPLKLLWNSPAWQTTFREDLPEAEKIAGLSRLWAEAKYNYAFFYRLEGIDWDALFLSYVPKVQATKSTYDYYRTLSEFCARLRDGHTSVYYPRELRERLGWPAISTRLVEGRVFIAEVRDPALARRGVARGLEIVSIDGLPVREYAEKNVTPYIAASTTQDREAKAFENSLLGGPVEQPVTLGLRDAGGTVSSVSLPRLSEAERNKLPHAPWSRFEHRVLEGNIAYVALRTFGSDELVADFDAAFAEIRNADGLILDVRENGGGNSGVGWAILGYLTGKPFASTQWRTRDYKPAFRAWGRTEKWHAQGPGELPPRGREPYARPVVVLTGARTYSAAEDFTAVFDAMDRGKIIGEPTGGSTGQPLMFPLPGGGSARICTKHDRYPDGKEFVGVGIQPDVLVRPTVEDFRAGRDPVLEAAIRELRREVRRY